MMKSYCLIEGTPLVRSDVSQIWSIIPDVSSSYSIPYSVLFKRSQYSQVHTVSSLLVTNQLT